MKELRGEDRTFRRRISPATISAMRPRIPSALWGIVSDAEREFQTDLAKIHSHKSIEQSDLPSPPPATTREREYLFPDDGKNAPRKISSKVAADEGLVLLSICATCSRAAPRAKTGMSLTSEILKCEERV